jgi:hypothetical protein
LGFFIHFAANKVLEEATKINSMLGVVVDFLGESGHFLAAVVTVHLIYDLFIKKQEIEIISDQINKQLSILKNDVLPKILTLVSDVENAKFRSQELIEGGELQGDYDIFKSQVDTYHKGLAKILNQTASEENGNLEIRFYKDLLSSPMYILSRDGMVIEGYTGFYLNMSASKFIFMKWMPAKKQVLDNIKSYFDNKWLQNEENRMDIDFKPQESISVDENKA